MDFVADSVNPALAIAAVAVAVRQWRDSRRNAVRFAVATLLGLAGIYAVMAMDAKLALFAPRGGDYSTHSAFAASVAISIAIWRRRWAIAVLTVLLAYLILIVVMRYHSAADVAIAAIIGFAVTVPWHLASRLVATRGERLNCSG